MSTTQTSAEAFCWGLFVFRYVALAFNLLLRQRPCKATARASNFVKGVGEGAVRLWKCFPGV